MTKTTQIDISAGNGTTVRPSAAKSKSGKIRVAGLPEASATKAAIILKLLGRKQGATIGDLTGATGWQAHSVRGFLSAIVRKKLGHELHLNKAASGERRYRIVAK